MFSFLFTSPPVLSFCGGGLLAPMIIARVGCGIILSIDFGRACDFSHYGRVVEKTPFAYGGR
ncbi:hypothetical protein [Bartonella elizabethae]|uniref:hypothetical protein n=1 Tax=Bartonella elizabethae TaxID=807 RepID=UPI0002ED1BD1|nr:hypothetical protein [Bartonella elizabethae]